MDNKLEDCERDALEARYHANQRHDLGLLKTWVVMFKNVIGARELIWQLFRRDFVAIYKKSFLGLAWAVVTPLSGVAMWLFLQGAGMLKPGNPDIPYPVYVLIGTTMWGLFMGFLTAASTTLQSGADLVFQVNFSHEVLLFKQASQHIANFIISLALCLVVALVYGVMPSPWTLAFPLVALPLFFLATGLGLLLSLIAVVAVDLSKVVNVVFPLLMFATPVIYTSNVESHLAMTLIKWNPLTYLVCSCRDIIIHGRLYDPTGYFISAAGSFLFFMFSWRLFYVSEDKLIERMV